MTKLDMCRDISVPLVTQICETFMLKCSRRAVGEIFPSTRKELDMEYKQLVTDSDGRQSFSVYFPC